MCPRSQVVLTNHLTGSFSPDRIGPLQAGEGPAWAAGNSSRSPVKGVRGIEEINPAGDGGVPAGEDFGSRKTSFGLPLTSKGIAGPGAGVPPHNMNISSAWFLPQEDFPVFYRYFGEKVTWSEAEEVCGCHHASLLSVQTGSQMDVARAYLKEIDVTDIVWIGLQKESPEKPFSWPNNEKLSGEGYWAEPIPIANEKLCAAIDPSADYRWSSHYCEGPQVASFVCELPVPEWARKENGCLITSLPSLTVTLVPEAGVIQLMADCGLDGTRTIACNSGVNREEIIKRLSCDVDAFASTIFGRSTTTDAARDVNTQQTSTAKTSSRMNRQETAKTFAPLTRHRRNTNLSSSGQEGTNSSSENGKVTSPTFLNVPPNLFPNSPYLVSKAPTTREPQTVDGRGRTPTERISTSTAAPPQLKDLPVLIITGEKINESASATSENPQIVLMIENKDLSKPFLVPLSDEADQASSSPVEMIDVDLVEVDNLTSNATTNQTTPAQGSAHPVRLSLAVANLTLEAEDADSREETSNAVEEAPQKPNRGRLLIHSNRPSFYPRFLNRVLG